MQNIFEKVKQSVKIADVVTYFGVSLDNNDKGLCPFHDEKTASLSIKRSDNIYTCFGCGASGDAIDFVARLKKIEQLDSAKLLAEIFKVELEKSNIINQSKKNLSEPTKQKPKEKPTNNIKQYLTECIKNVSLTDYFFKRGLSQETIERYCLGYDVKQKAVTLPYSSKLEYYQTRRVGDKAFFKPKSEDAGLEPIFNQNALYTKKRDVVFVVESPICALSIMQCGYSAISTCGIGTTKLNKQLKSKQTKNILLLALDNDEAGEKASQDLASALCELNTKFAVFNISGKCKDPNELLMENPQKLKCNLALAKQIAMEKYQTAKDSFSAFELQKKDIPPPRWIIENLLCEGLGFICAPSKLGKSWLVLQMCLAVSQSQTFMGFDTNKSGCLYYALEDNKHRLQDRLNKILKNAEAPKNLYFTLEANFLNDGLLEQIASELDSHPDIKFVVIDTFQMIRGKPMRKNDVYGNDYAELKLLKNFAVERKICLLLVHHVRKADDESDVFNKVLGSGGIMGVSDAMIMLTKKKRMDEDTTMSITGRDVVANEYLVTFNKATFKWEMLGDASEQEHRKANLAYQADPLAQTIKAIVEKHPYGWEGGASDLIKASSDFLGKCITDSPTSIGKKISALEFKLYDDGIAHTVKGGRSTGRKHIFYNRFKKKEQVSFLNVSTESGENDPF